MSLRPAGSGAVARLVREKLIFGPPRFIGWEFWANWLPVRWRARYLAWRLMRGPWKGNHPEHCVVRLATSRGMQWYQITTSSGRIEPCEPVNYR